MNGLWSACLAMALIASCGEGSTAKMRAAHSDEGRQPNSQSRRQCVQKMPAVPPPPSSNAESCPPDPVFARAGGKMATVGFPETTPPVKISAELAKNMEQRTRGLMYRRSMPDNQGMLFDFVEEGPRIHSFWMRNTCISLDMIFISEDGVIVGVLENVPVLNDAPRSVSCSSSYVLEVNAGWVRKSGVAPGQKIELPPR